MLNLKPNEEKLKARGKNHNYYKMENHFVAAANENQNQRLGAAARKTISRYAGAELSAFGYM